MIRLVLCVMAALPVFAQAVVTIHISGVHRRRHECGNPGTEQLAAAAGRAIP